MDKETVLRKSNGLLEPITLNKEQFSYSQITSVTNEKSLQLSDMKLVDIGVSIQLSQSKKDI